MNYDLNTEKGLQDAVIWTVAHMGRIRSGGVWFIPRSSTVVTVVSHEPPVCKIDGYGRDDSLRTVLVAAGWRISLDIDRANDVVTSDDAGGDRERTGCHASGPGCAGA